MVRYRTTANLVKLTNHISSLSEIQVADDFGVDFGEIGLPDRAVEADGVVHDEAAERRRGSVLLQYGSPFGEIDRVVGAADRDHKCRRKRRTRNTLERPLKIARCEYCFVLENLERGRGQDTCLVIIRTRDRDDLVADRDIGERDRARAFFYRRRSSDAHGRRTKRCIGHDDARCSTVDAPYGAGKRLRFAQERSVADACRVDDHVVAARGKRTVDVEYLTFFDVLHGRLLSVIFNDSGRGTYENDHADECIAPRGAGKKIRAGLLEDRETFDRKFSRRKDA